MWESWGLWICFQDCLPPKLGGSLVMIGPQPVGYVLTPATWC